MSSELHQPVYWAGARSGSRLELTRTKDGEIYVRYLTGTAKLGDSRAAFLTVGTYPFADAYQAVKKISKKPGATVEHNPDGGLVVTNPDSPTSVYLAYPDQDFQVEVYDPDPKRALGLATSGAVRPIR